MFSAGEINGKRIELSREKNEAVLIAILAFMLWLLPLCKRSPIWVDLTFRLLAVGNAATLVRRADDISRQEQLLGAQIHVSRQLLQKYINVEAYKEEQAIVGQIMPPPPELPVEPQYQLPERSQQRSAEVGEVEQGQAGAIATQSLPYDDDEAEDEADEFSWSKDLMEYPAILVWGPQGSGKTSFASWLTRERIKRGHTATILDPHREFGQWEGLKVIGDGMDYEALDGALEVFENRIKRHYQKRSRQANYNPKPRTTLVDEFTNWASRCKNAATFFATALSDIRKVNEGVIFISHARTMTGLGGAKGLAATRDASLLELELEAIVDPETKKARPALRGKLKYPGREPIAVKIAPWMKGSMDFRDIAERSPQEYQDIPRKAQPVSDDPYAYRYPPNWGEISHLTKVLTGKVCCYPGCTNQTTETHHACYQNEQGQSICNDPIPGEHLYGLCDEHHGDRANPESAHHPNNWIKGERKDLLEIDSRNTREYHQLLKQGFQEKLIYPDELAA